MDHSFSALPPLDGLRAMLVSGETGSFTLAAEVLGLTHGAVSRRVAAVEAWLGVAVFERHGRGVRLTPAGQRFTRQVRQALEALEQTSERWRPGRGRSTVRLSVVPSFAKLWLIPRLAGLLEVLPDIRIELTADHRTVDLAADEADLVIRYGSGEWPGLQARHLFSESLLPAGAPGVVERLGRAPDDEALARRPLLHDSDSSQWRAWFARGGTRYRPKPDDRRFEDYDLVLAAAEGGLGLALVRLPLAKSWLASGRLVAASSRRVENPLGHYVAHRRDEHRPGVLRLADALCSLAHDEGAGPGT